MITNQAQYTEQEIEKTKEEIVKCLAQQMVTLGMARTSWENAASHPQQLDKAREVLNELRCEAATFKSTLTHQLNEQANQVKEQVACIVELVLDIERERKRIKAAHFEESMKYARRSVSVADIRKYQEFMFNTTSSGNA